MPSLYTHQIIAEKVFEKMGKPNYIKNNFNEFLMGSLGFEIFNYHRLLKMLKNSYLEQLSSVLKYIKHKEFLMALIEKSKGDIKLMVYTLGFLTNYAADTMIRPYIHSVTEKPEGGGDTIKQIEFEQALDAYIYREKEMENTVEQANFLNSVKRRDIRRVSGFLSSVCRYVADNKRIWRKDIVASFDDTRDFTRKIKIEKEDAVKKMKIHEAMIGKTGRIAIFVPPNIITGNDVFNLAHRTWRAPWLQQKARNESVTDLIKKSVDFSVDIINQISEYYLGECETEKVESIIGNVNFNGREM